MNTCSYVLVLCFGVVLSAQLTKAIGTFEVELLITKLDYLQDKLHDVEQTMTSSLKETEQRIQEKLTKHENNIDEKNAKIEAKLHAMEDSLKKSVQMNEENTRKLLEELRTQLISEMNNIQQQQMAETKTLQETSQTELKQLGESKKTLDMLTDSVQNITTKNSTPIRSCRHVTNQTGMYIINTDESTFNVLCEQNMFDGGWTVIQHRFDGSIDFYRNWTEYRNGFGKLNGEFWLGLEFVHQITKTRPHELLVEIKDFHGNYGYAKYAGFEIGSETEQFKLKKLGRFSGTARDSMDLHKKQQFTTFDRDNDQGSGNCAVRWHGAWWYNYCHTSNLNGLYQNTIDDSRAMSWYDFKFDRRGLAYSRMMIRDIIN
ncbi:AGAP011223-PA-like protein [Anopheles sinensis]|uniref:AGAP011223-PA-like protein n=1 Tax=Anopheles sinensis TaxID=74873 RepID=A0A084VSW4_ANOSI|nr:AGAP011223-PA-like protein [Anopheles sinensis]